MTIAHDAERPRLSVVVTNHNYGRFLPDAVESALDQGEETEVVVVDDGSTDDSREIIGRYGDRVSAILQPNGGQAAAFNAGFRASRGSIVIFLDADDLLEPDIVDELTAAFTSGVAHAHWQMSLADTQGRPVGGLRPPQPAAAGDLREAVATRGPGHLQITPTSGNAFARSFLDTVLPMPTDGYRNGGGDLYLSWLAAATAPVAAISRPLSRYRRHGANDNITGTTDERIDRGLEWARLGFAAVAERLRLDPGVVERWAADEWWHQAEAVRAAVHRHVPSDAAVLIVDDHLWAVRGSFAGRPAVQLMTDDDDGLVEQTKAAVASGTAHLAVPGFCQWWFEHFPRWAQWVRANADAMQVTSAATIVSFGHAR